MAVKHEYQLEKDDIEATAPETREIPAAETRAFAVIVKLLQQKWLVIGIPVIAIIIAVIFVVMRSSSEKTRITAASAYAKSRSAQEYMSVYQKYPKTAYGAYALEKAAKMALENGDYAQARELSEKFIAEYPQNNLAIYVKTYIPISLENEGKYKEAIAKYKEILEQDPQRDLVLDLLNMCIGRCYELDGDLENAKSYFGKVTARSGFAGAALEGVPTVWNAEAAERIRKIAKKEQIIKSAQEPEAPKAGN